jgi:ATP-binding cassette, subfamily B, bacterial
MLFRVIGTGIGLVWRASGRNLAVVAGLQLSQGLGLLGVLLSAQAMLDAGLGAGSLAQALPAVGLLVGALAAVGLIQAVVTERELVLGEAVSIHVQGRVLDAAAAMPYDAFETPDLYDRLQRARMGADFGPLTLVQGLVMLAGGVTGTAGVVVGLAAIEPLLLPLVAVAAAPVIVASVLGGRLQARVHLGLSTVERERGYLVDLLTSRTAAKEIRVFGLGPHLRHNWTGLSRQRLSAVAGGARRQRRLLAFAGLLSATVTGASIALLAHLMISGRLDVAQAGAAGAAVLLLGAQLRGLASAGAMLSEATPFITDLASTLALPREVSGSAGSRPVAPRAFQRIRFEDVHYTYPSGETPALRGVTLDIRQGEVVAVVGENGSGKTTLAKLLCALHRPTSGRITWDGADLASLDPDSVRDRIAVLFQDFQRFQLRARDNIGFGRVDRLDDSAGMEAAADRAGIAKALCDLPQGYESRLGPEWAGGTDLSGGQWQRLALARAYFRDAPLVVLDEPTASLDPRAEQQLFDAVRGLYQNRTVLLISHRFATVRSADRILVMRDGQVVESGDHESLMAADGLYAELYSLQSAQLTTDTGHH